VDRAGAAGRGAAVRGGGRGGLTVWRRGHKKNKQREGAPDERGRGTGGTGGKESQGHKGATRKGFCGGGVWSTVGSVGKWIRPMKTGRRRGPGGRTGRANRIVWGGWGFWAEGLSGKERRKEKG